MLRIQWTDKVTSEEIVRIGYVKKFIVIIIKRQLNFLRHTMKKEGSVNLKLIRQIKVTRTRKKGLCN